MGEDIFIVVIGFSLQKRTPKGLLSNRKKHRRRKKDPEVVKLRRRSGQKEKFVTS